ncbi:MAG: flagellar basal body rod protein FlgC [Dehalococcoidia bacterium]
MGLVRAISTAASGLTAQRVRMDVVAANIANMNTTRTPDGDGPYLRRVVRFAAAGASPFDPVASRLGRYRSGVVVASTAIDRDTPTRRVYDPGHADADEDGFVEMPNVDVVTEMTNLTSANRSYGANVTVLNAVKEMALRALDIANR